MHIFYNIKLHFLDNYDKFMKGDRYSNKIWYASLFYIISITDVNLAPNFIKNKN